MRGFFKFFLIMFVFFGCSEPEESSYSLNITINPSNGGTVDPGSGTYNEGKMMQIHATPDIFYEFTSWEGDYNGADNPLNIELDGDKNLICNFKLKDTDGDGVTDNKDVCRDTPEGMPTDENGCLNPIYTDENGVTLKCYDWAEIGEYTVNGTVYTIVDEEKLKTMIKNHEDLNTVVTTKITDMFWMFDTWTTSDISSWDVGNVTDMRHMFTDSYFNGDISNWDVSNVTDMSWMFSSSSFNMDISQWDVSNVTDMCRMFHDSEFNGDISNWKMNNVTDMSYMFHSSSFNGDISNWDVSNVTDMNDMFSWSIFNEDISNWDVSSVTDMTTMFRGSQFNQDLSSWNVANVKYYSGFSNDCPQWVLPKPNFQ